MRKPSPLIEDGHFSFSVESRILRELGERLVKQPEVAILELIKNSYDADAKTCTVDVVSDAMIVVSDDGHGMTLRQFRLSWMRVGTSAKAKQAVSKKYNRLITGEKGIGRFAVRFLGRHLRLISVANDSKHGRTELTVEFDWRQVDKAQDIGDSPVPYQLRSVDRSIPLGTRLEISKLGVDPADIHWKKIRTGSIGVVSPLRALIDATSIDRPLRRRKKQSGEDPGFALVIQRNEDEEADTNIAIRVLDSYVLRAKVELSSNALTIGVFERGGKRPFLKVVDRFNNEIGWLKADLRFFPRRQGTFEGVPIDGRRAYSWINENSGVAVFDRNFRVLPYGLSENDWLQLQADAARNRRDPRSNIAKKHYPMESHERGSPKLNWMLRLPQSAQLIGIVQVRGQHSSQQDKTGLIAAADREGFLENDAFGQFYEVIRGAVEMLAVADRRIQLRTEELDQAAGLRQSRQETKNAIEEIQHAENIPTSQKKHIVSFLLSSQKRLESQEAGAAERQTQLEIMSLLGVIAGYMTHEFDTALDDIQKAHRELLELADDDTRFIAFADTLEGCLGRLEEFSRYSRAYVTGVRNEGSKSFLVRPRIRQIVKLFSSYTDERDIEIEVHATKQLKAPGVPVTLYNGILQNLFTNALKAVSAKRGSSERMIAFRAWNDPKWHYLQVSDTGVGIPPVLRDRVFDPLFSTTDVDSDALGVWYGSWLVPRETGRRSVWWTGRFSACTSGLLYVCRSTVTASGGRGEVRITENPLILLIDDVDRYLEPLLMTLKEAVPEDVANVEGWMPKGDDGDPEDVLNKYFENGLMFVVTDFDLTKKGMLGFQGPSVQHWCQRKLIPVGDFSRARTKDLPKEPSLFQFRVPLGGDREASLYIASVFTGFRDIRSWLNNNKVEESLSNTMARMLDRASLEPELSLYFSRLFTSNTAIRDYLLVKRDGDEVLSAMLDVVAYVIGHVLLNLVMAFPGPILTCKVLAAYLSTTEEEALLFVENAEVKRYGGPFWETQPMFWKNEVDDALLDAAGEEIAEDVASDLAEFNRWALAKVLGRDPTRHDCRREGVNCDGRYGGYWCPLTGRTVCLREECSISSKAWIPDGADLCRVEADYFQEYAPLLGL